MASQNIPGIAAMKTFGYPLRPSLWFSTTGALSIVAAPFGGVAVNLAAITAAMVTGEDAHPDKDKRYWASIVNGIGYIFFGLTAAGITAFVSLAPTILIQAGFLGFACRWARYVFKRPPPTKHLITGLRD